jgi:hypothetical protein
MQPVYLPLYHALSVLDRKYDADNRRKIPVHYREDLMRSMKNLCKSLRLEFETLEMDDEYARQITRSLYKELDRLRTSEEIKRLIGAFCERFVITEEGREEARRIIQGRICCAPDSDCDTDCEEDCTSECDTDCDESTEESERSARHRMRMTIRELLGSEACARVVYRQKTGKRIMRK